MNIGNTQSCCRGPQAEWRDEMKAVKQDFQKLQKALKAGDLSSAQDAYASLQKDLPAPKDSSNGGATQSRTDLEAVGSALESGDLAGAQKAFVTFVQDVRSARGSHGHRHHPDDDASTRNDSTSVTTGLTNNSLNVQA